MVCTTRGAGTGRLSMNATNPPAASTMTTTVTDSHNHSPRRRAGAGTTPDSGSTSVLVNLDSTNDRSTVKPRHERRRSALPDLTAG
jgi:hypothetical protein